MKKSLLQIDAELRRRFLRFLNGFDSAAASAPLPVAFGVLSLSSVVLLNVNRELRHLNSLLLQIHSELNELILHKLAKFS